jgi:Fe-S-cluster containining protein
MSTAERAAIVAADTLPAGVDLRWSPLARGFWTLRAGPCPLLTAEHRCAVYAVRPRICREFMCGRVDPVTEPFVEDRVTGCANLTARLRESLRFREHYRTNAAHVARERQAHG